VKTLTDEQMMCPYGPTPIGYFATTPSPTARSSVQHSEQEQDAKDVIALAAGLGLVLVAALVARVLMAWAMRP